MKLSPRPSFKPPTLSGKSISLSPRAMSLLPGHHKSDKPKDLKTSDSPILHMGPLDKKQRMKKGLAYRYYHLHTDGTLVELRKDTDTEPNNVFRKFSSVEKIHAKVNGKYGLKIVHDANTHLLYADHEATRDQWVDVLTRFVKTEEDGEDDEGETTYTFDKGQLGMRFLLRDDVDVVVVAMTNGALAMEAGIKLGDVVTKINGKKIGHVDRVSELTSKISAQARPFNMTFRRENAPIDLLVISQPDDFHLHIRDGDICKAVFPMSAKVFGKAIIMPNINPPIRTTKEALEYKERILNYLDQADAANFIPLMTLYLTGTTTPEEIEAAVASKAIYGVKLYPPGATTNADYGVLDINSVDETLAKMEELGLPLLIHGEVPEVDIFDREKEFIESKLRPLLEAHPDLKVVVEHVTTKEMAEFVTNSEHKHLGATITPQHLMFTRNDLFKPPNKPGTALNPHLFCLPVLKAEEDRLALVKAATSGNKRFFAGTDSAPHLRKSKESGCCSAGVFSAPIAVEVYTTIFDRENALDKLEAFLTTNGCEFYGLQKNSFKMRLQRLYREVPLSYKVEGEDDDIVPMFAGESLEWTAELLEN